jgi:hypothetical protein
MEKIIILVNNGLRPCQVDDFPLDCERSSIGSLYFKPGTMEITKDELKHIRKYHKNINRKLSIIFNGPMPKKTTLSPNLDLKNKLRELDKLREKEEELELKNNLKEFEEKEEENKDSNGFFSLKEEFNSLFEKESKTKAKTKKKSKKQRYKSK